MLHILDCTLRDGGFYTDWHFEPALVRALLEGLDEAGVDIIELGYRSPRTGGHGPFKYCDESALAIPPLRHAQLAFMVDLKDADRSSIGPRCESRFAWARVAAHPEAIEPACELASWLRDQGYATAINVMGASTAAPATLSRVFRRADVDVLYLADSFGSLTPEQTTALIASARAQFTGSLGVHLHDNLGLAHANALAAIAAGATFIDTTVAGMGRGAGNVRTEQLLATLPEPRRPGALLPALGHVLALQAQHRWGPSYAYLVSALSGIHPMYCQELETRGCELAQIVAILDAIAPVKRARFEPAALAAAEARLQRRSS